MFLASGACLASAGSYQNQSKNRRLAGFFNGRGTLDCYTNESCWRLICMVFKCISIEDGRQLSASSSLF
jgi:hypothetical protein